MEPVPTKTSAATSATSSTKLGPSGQVPGEAPEATGDLAGELKAAAGNYYAALNRAYATGDDLPVRALITPTCLCVNSLNAIRGTREEGRKFQIQYEISSLRAYDLTKIKAGTGGVKLLYSIAKNTLTDKDGKVLENYNPVNNGIKDLTFERQASGRWLLAEVFTTL
ncbi:MAG: hypothetical protein ABIM89_03950 [Mycobacteriales bacterium]